MKRWQLTPSHSPVAARKRWEHTKDFLSAADYDLLVEENSIGTVDGETKFVFLRNAFAFADEFYGALSQLKFKQSKRAAGQDLLFGYYWDRRNSAHPTLTIPTAQHQLFYDTALAALLDWMGTQVKRHLPEYWKEQRQSATLTAYDHRPHNAMWDALASKLAGKLSVEQWDDLEAHKLNEPIFSTVTINRSAPFLPHCDAKNEGGLACLMAFGEFSGGDLCLPRLRTAFRLRPGDLLIADNNREYHGNVGAIYGDRISLVAYLRRLGTRIS